MTEDEMRLHSKFTDAHVPNRLRETLIARYSAQYDGTVKPFIDLGEADGSIFLSEFKDEHLQTNEFPSHTATKIIGLRTIKFSPTKYLVDEDQNVAETPRAALYPKTMAQAREVAKAFGKGELSRFRVAFLEPGQRITPHYDGGLYYAIRDRYHIVVSNRGSVMTWNNDDFTWQQNRLYWFNNKWTHSVYNDTDETRIHLVFDVLPFKNFELRDQLQEWALKEYVDKS